MILLFDCVQFYKLIKQWKLDFKLIKFDSCGKLDGWRVGKLENVIEYLIFGLLDFLIVGLLGYATVEQLGSWARW